MSVLSRLQSIRVFCFHLIQFNAFFNNCIFGADGCMQSFRHSLLDSSWHNYVSVNVGKKTWFHSLQYACVSFNGCVELTNASHFQQRRMNMCAGILNCFEWWRTVMPSVSVAILYVYVLLVIIAISVKNNLKYFSLIN